MFILVDDSLALWLPFGPFINFLSLCWNYLCSSILLLILVNFFITITWNSLSGKLFTSALLRFFSWSFVLFFCLEHSSVFPHFAWLCFCMLVETALSPSCEGMVAGRLGVCSVCCVHCSGSAQNCLWSQPQSAQRCRPPWPLARFWRVSLCRLQAAARLGGAAGSAVLGHVCLLGGVTPCREGLRGAGSRGKVQNWPLPVPLSLERVSADLPVDL